MAPCVMLPGRYILVTAKDGSPVTIYEFNTLGKALGDSTVTWIFYICNQLYSSFKNKYYKEHSLTDNSVTELSVLINRPTHSDSVENDNQV
jgi:hypothetical protein